VADASPARTITATGPEEDRWGALVRRIVVALEPSREDRRVMVLGSEPLVLGRDAEGVDLRIDDQRVSRQHARIRREEGIVTVTDLGSHNGTYVDGVRRDHAELEDGAVLRVGRSLLLYVEANMGDPSLLVDEAAPLYGPSPAMARVRGDIGRVAPTAIPVLVLGESGVGKELVARAVHARSGRRGPFVAVNCATLSAHLAEAELFGHEAGAFTGATQRREGLFVAAANGTLFLDEVGDLPPVVQPKLLRALALGEVRPVGSSSARRADVRVVAATNRDLDAAVEEGSFRKDLLARLAGWTVRIPPLRRRREDILPLARHHLRERARLDAPAAEALLLFDYPHNVRDLEHELDAALARWDGKKLLGREHFSDRLASRSRPTEAAGAPRAPLPPGAAPSADDLRRALERARGNVAQVAAFFGRDRHQVYRWAEQLGLDLKSFRRR
jgi:DNA-binding NtrC family response regulator